MKFQDQQEYEKLENMIGSIVAVAQRDFDSSWVDWMRVDSVEVVWDADGTYDIFAIGKYYDGQNMDVYPQREAELFQIIPGKIPGPAVRQKLQKRTSSQELA